MTDRGREKEREIRGETDRQRGGEKGREIESQREIQGVTEQAKDRERDGVLEGNRERWGWARRERSDRVRERGREVRMWRQFDGSRLDGNEKA